MKTTISKNPNVPSLVRNVEPLLITYMDFINKEAKIQFRITNYTDLGVDVGLNQEFWATISDNNKVNVQGQMIKKEDCPLLTDETEEEYEVRFKAIQDAGYGQFTFWLASNKSKGMEAVLAEGILLLDGTQYFD
tara:strand:- start:48 stop:449 length:402 start_codon:yes stop_codon:yes gene_type:complete